MKYARAGKIAQSVNCLSCKHEIPHKNVGEVVHAVIPGGSLGLLPNQSSLMDEYQANRRPCHQRKIPDDEVDFWPAQATSTGTDCVCHYGVHSLVHLLDT